MTETGPISNQPFKDLNFQSSPLSDYLDDAGRGAGERADASGAEGPEDIPWASVGPLLSVSPKMVARTAELITSLPDLAARAHKLASGQMFSIEG